MEPEKKMDYKSAMDYIDELENKFKKLKEKRKRFNQSYYKRNKKTTECPVCKTTLILSHLNNHMMTIKHKNNLLKQQSLQD